MVWQRRLCTVIEQMLDYGMLKYLMCRVDGTHDNCTAIAEPVGTKMTHRTIDWLLCHLLLL